MTTDYISTTPWDNPSNPWPFYSEVTVSSTGISSTTLTLSVFNPNIDLAVQYGNGVGGRLNYRKSGGWEVSDGTDTFNLSTTVYAIPAKTATAGVSGGWVRVAGAPGGADTLSIVPNVNEITDWNKRRLWNLNG
jgi:hypothetical protein